MRQLRRVSTTNFICSLFTGRGGQCGRLLP
nr:MAG TPA: hypothetical protein [Caudoviricetes sp.]DAY20915.1 MAG TPA: hypothetical protein [Caudoviricetes sp.]